MKMTNEQYDELKDWALCWMPYGITFIGVVLEALDIPNAAAIMAVLVAANAFLGNVVKYFKNKYDKEEGNNE